jgi:hypothetical protein
MTVDEFKQITTAIVQSKAQNLIGTGVHVQLDGVLKILCTHVDGYDVKMEISQNGNVFDYNYYFERKQT